MRSGVLYLAHDFDSHADSTGRTRNTSSLNRSSVIYDIKGSP